MTVSSEKDKSMGWAVFLGNDFCVAELTLAVDIFFYQEG